MPWRCLFSLAIVAALSATLLGQEVEMLPLPAEEVARAMPQKSVGEVFVSARPPRGQLPEDRSQAIFTSPESGFAAGSRVMPGANGVFSWAPAELAHQPLYFDDPMLERNGQSICPAVQPVISAARFWGAFPVMPVKILVQRPFSPVYSFGGPRPGSPAPCLRQR